MADITIGQLLWKINGDSTGLNKELGKTDKKVGKTSSAFGKAAKYIGTALVAVGVGKFVKSLINASSDAEETANKFGVVFSKMSKQANETAKDIAAGYGLSRTAAKDLLASTGNVAQGIGYTQAESLKLSDTLVRLGADITSFTNYSGGGAEATRILTKSLLGERDALQALDLKVTQAELDALAKASGRVYKNMTQQEQAQLTLDVIMKKSKNSIGDFSRSINSYANQLRIAEANVQDMQVSLGDALLPIATLGIKVFNEVAVTLKDTADEITAFVKSAEGAGKIGDIFGTIAGAMSALKTVVQPVVEGLGEAVDNVVDPFKDLSGEGVEAAVIFQRLAQIFTILGATIQVAGRLIGGTIQYIIDLGKVAYNAGQLVSSLFDALRGKGFAGAKKDFEALAEAGKNLGTNLSGMLVDIADTVVKTASTFGEKTDKIADDANRNFIETFTNVKKEVVDALTAVQEASGSTSEEVGKSAESINEKFVKFNKEIETTLESITTLGSGILDVFSSLSAYQDAVFSKRLEQLEEQTEAELEAIDTRMQAELVAAGVADETAIQKAQTAITEAKRIGDNEGLIEAQKALKKAQIEEKYRKEKEAAELKIARQKAQLEYEAATQAWEMQRLSAIVGGALSVINAYSSAAGIPMVGWIIAPIAAGIAAVAAGIQIAAVQASKPSPPAFASGGIVPGNPAMGDTQTVNATPGELILNKAQQGNIASQLGGGMRRVKPMDAELTWSELYQASKNGYLYIHEGAITNK